jgi:hypothetical protein
MHRVLFGYVVLAGISGLMGATAEDHRPAVMAISQLPLSFEPATSGNTRWTVRGEGYRLAVGAADVEVALREEQLRIRFVGGNGKASSEGLDTLPGKANYFIGRDPKGWLRDIPTYQRVRYQSVYPGVDVLWYGKQGRLEYDLELEPGADAGRIAMRFEGARKMAVEASGDLRVEMAGGPLWLKLPEVYQDGIGGRKRIVSGYELRAGNEVGFHLGAYDKSRPLVIDPTLVYGSYLGSGFSVAAVATDSLGNVYVGGIAGAGLATVNALQPGSMGSSNCFIMKLDPTATTVLYSTYIGGSGSASSAIAGLAVDSSGALVGTGETGAKDFPLVNAAWSTYDATNNESAFVLKLSANGSAFVYSTYLSGSYGSAVALDGTGNAYVVGATFATAVATPGAWQTVYGGGTNDAFVAKLGPAGALVYLTLLGGSGYDQGTGIAVDSLGNAYVAGYTDSVSFPNSAPGARTTNNGGNDAFIAKISPDGSSVPWLTFLGGTEDETVTALVRDPSSGTLYVAGSTTSADLPTTAGVVQPSANGPEQGFVASLNPDGMSFGFVTYLGGRKVDLINAMTLTPTGQLAVAGTSSSDDLASVNAIQPAFIGNGLSFFKSVNSGGSWTPSDTGLPSQVLALTGDPTSASTILAVSANPLSVFRTTNGGTSWLAEPLAAGLWCWMSPPAFVRSPAKPAVVYVYFPFSCGPPPNDHVFRSTDGGVTWTGLANPPVSSYDYLEGVALSGTDANTLVEVFLSGAVYRSTDGGATFNALSSLTAYPCSVAWTWAAPVTSSPDGSFYLGTYGGICKSTDNGSTWSLLAGSSVLGNLPTTIAVSSSTPSVVYVLMPGGAVYRSPDGGATWNLKTTPGSVSEIAVAPSNSQVVYAAGSGSGVFVSTDGAATWSPTAALPSGISAIAVNPSDPTAVYAGLTSATDGFVAKLSTAGTSLLWSTFYTGSSGSNPAAIASVASGDVWIAGSTSSTDLPITANAYSSISTGTSTGLSTGFLARISDTTASCSFRLNPSSWISDGSQNPSFAVTAPSGCAWTATPSDNTWITIQTGASGTASGTVSATLTANNTGSTRVGSISVNGQAFSITQAASGCTYHLDNTTALVPATGGNVVVHLTAGAGCPWSTVPQDTFVTVVSGGSGNGNGTITLSVPPIAGAQTVTSHVKIGPQTLTINQQSTCTYSLVPLVLPATSGSGTISVTTNFAGCSWSPGSDADWLQINSNGSTGSGTISYTVTTNTTGGPRVAHVTLVTGTSIAITQAGALRFVPVTPCRIADTRNPDGPFGGPILGAAISRDFNIPASACGIPGNAAAYSLNLTVVPVGPLGYVSVWPSGQSQPVVSTLNSLDGRIKANAAIVPAGVNGAVTLFASDSTHAIIDINGYFVPASGAQNLAFYPVTPCRVADTRNPTGTFGGPALAPSVARTFPVPASTCGIPASAQAYAFNMTVVPSGSLGFLTTWPAGTAQPTVSTLNALTGVITSNAAIVPAGVSGGTTVYATNTTDLIVDINGYFAPPGTGSLDFYTATPCRVLDTRNPAGPLGGPIMGAGGSRSFVVPSSTCGIPATARAYSLNATVVPPGSLSFLTLWGSGAQPLVSTLNSLDGTIVANAALVPAGGGGEVTAYTTNLSHLILDINGYFQ